MASSNSGRRVDNTGPILMSPGGTFNISSLVNGLNDSSPHATSKSPSPDTRPVEGAAPNANNQLLLRELYGGAMSIKIPGSFRDVSAIREVIEMKHLMKVASKTPIRRSFIDPMNRQRWMFNCFLQYFD